MLPPPIPQPSGLEDSLVVFGAFMAVLWVPLGVWWAGAASATGRGRGAWDL